MDDFQHLKLILLVFKCILELKININKSTIVGISTIQDLITKLSSLLGCKVSNQSLTFLGLPLGVNLKASTFWDPMIERISRRFDGWNKKFCHQGENNSYSVMLVPHP